MSEKTLLDHTLFLENRSKMTVTGVLQVVAYDEFHIILKTDCGRLIIQGRNLVAGEISSSRNTLKLTGDIQTFVYKGAGDKDGLFSRIFR